MDFGSRFGTIGRDGINNNHCRMTNMSTDVFTIIGFVIVFLFAGIGIGTFTIWVINKFLTHITKTLKVWKLFVDFVFEYKEFKKYKNDHTRISSVNQNADIERTV